MLQCCGARWEHHPACDFLRRLLRLLLGGLSLCWSRPICYHHANFWKPLGHPKSSWQLLGEQRGFCGCETCCPGWSGSSGVSPAVGGEAGLCQMRAAPQLPSIPWHGMSRIVRLLVVSCGPRCFPKICTPCSVDKQVCLFLI